MADYGSQLIKLLPPGSLWFLEQVSDLRALLAGLGDELERVRLRGVDLINESDPRTATETIGEWETALGLPDAQVPVLSAILAERRSAVVQKLVATGGQNPAFYARLATACGWTLISVTPYASKVLRVKARVGDRVYGAGYAYSLLVTFHTPGGAGSLAVADLERVFRAATHAHITVVFSYTT